MTQIVSAVLLLGGTLFMLVAVVGMLRLPDIFMRMHAITKAGTLGVGLIFGGLAVFFGDLSVVTRSLAVIAFVMLTAPVSAHMIGRAAYLDDVGLWEGTLVDEMSGLYKQLEEEAAEDRRKGFGDEPEE
jgi:multicomponent Na+:H+ antiporter subunit G